MFNNGLDVGGHSKASKAGNGGKLSAEVLTLLETSFCEIDANHSGQALFAQGSRRQR